VKLLVVTVWHVLSQEEQSNGRSSLHDSGNEECNTPRNKMSAPDLFYQLEHQGHYQLRCSTSQVAPAARKSIGPSNLFQKKRNYECASKISFCIHPSIARTQLSFDALDILFQFSFSTFQLGEGILIFLYECMSNFDVLDIWYMDAKENF
jgi:hypothetical protein